MVFCKVYCHTPPEELDKCDSTIPIIRVGVGMRKRVNFKMFPSCGMTSLYETPETKANVILRPNMFVLDVVATPDNVGIATYSVVDDSGLSVQTGTVEVPLNGIFHIDLSAIQSAGYYTLKITYFDGHNDSACMFKLYVCP